MFGSITAECFLGNLDANSTSIVIEHGKGCDGLRLCQGNISSSRLMAVNGFFMQGGWLTGSVRKDLREFP